jgi:hypothetical protein
MGGRGIAKIAHTSDEGSEVLGRVEQGGEESRICVIIHQAVDLLRDRVCEKPRGCIADQPLPRTIDVIEMMPGAARIPLCRRPPPSIFRARYESGRRVRSMCWRPMEVLGEVVG